MFPREGGKLEAPELGAPGLRKEQREVAGTMRQTSKEEMLRGKQEANDHFGPCKETGYGSNCDTHRHVQKEDMGRHGEGTAIYRPGADPSLTASEGTKSPCGSPTSSLQHYEKINF